MASDKLGWLQPSGPLIRGHEKRVPSRLAGCFARRGAHKGMRMTKANKGAGSAAPKKKLGAVVPLAPLPPAAIQPPDGWQLKTPFGYMRSNAAEGGELVRLADLVRWLEETRQVPRKRAIELLLEALPADVMDWLFQLHPLDYAAPVPTDHLFGQKTAEQIQAEEVAAQNPHRRGEYARDPASRATNWRRPW